MIQVISGFPNKVYDIDADEAIMLAGREDVGETLLVLTKDNVEVAWFANWASAIQLSKLKGTRSMKEDKND